MLRGRQAECALLDSLIDGAAESRSGVLVIRGDPGVGKSELLRYAESRFAPGCCLRGVGVESEVRLPYAVLHQLLYPYLGRLDSLPPAQAAALQGAFGITPHRNEDPFLVAVGVLTLLADLAADAGLLCLVDDAHWLDQPSVDALVFVARRLQAEGIVLIFVAREGDVRCFTAPGLPELWLSGLEAPVATALLAECAPSMSRAVARDLVASTGGNPLALLELPSMLTSGQRSGAEPLPVPLPLGRGVEQAFAAAAANMAADSRSLLLVAAAEETGDLRTVLRAADVLGIELAALGEGERAGLVRIATDHLEFRHPLARSAVYQRATLAERQSAHRALAEALDGLDQVDRRAWHRSAATVLPDAELAADLERSADRARCRAGPGAAANALERSAALTADDRERGRRLLAAADAAWASGTPHRAVALLDRADPLVAAPRLRAAMLHLRGLVELRGGVPETAYDLLLSSADLADPHEALASLVLAGEAASFTGEPALFIELGGLAAALAPSADDDDQLMISMLVGMAEAMSGDWGRGGARIRAVVAAGQKFEDPLALLRVGRAALAVADDRAARQLHTRAVDQLRRTGAVGLLPTALDRLAFSDLLAGRLADAVIGGTESMQLARHMGQEAAHHLNGLAVAEAWRGNADACRRYAGHASTLSGARHMAMISSVSSWALGLLALGQGHPGEALTHLEPMFASPGGSHPGARLWATPDFVESAARAGRPDVARAAAHRFEAWAEQIELSWARAVAGRCRALLNPGREALRTLAASADLHADGARPLERARTELVYGEALRRARQRTESRLHLRAAIEDFQRLGAEPWAERARVELRATGETAHSPTPFSRDRLTPQELQISRLVAAGASNPEIAAQLFISRRTVEYHLHKVFTKLGLASRTELIRVDLD